MSNSEPLIARMSGAAVGRELTEAETRLVGGAAGPGGPLSMSDTLSQDIDWTHEGPVSIDGTSLGWDD